jgi:tight adherence protein C
VTVEPLTAGALAAVAVSGGLLSVPLLRDRGPVDRLAARAGAERSERRHSLIRRLVERLAGRIGPRLAPGIRLSRREALARRLDLAGRPGGLTVQRFIGIKGALALLTGGFFGVLAIIGGSWLIAFVAVVTGWFGPDILLSRAGRLRQERIERDLPDFLDILAVTVRAGLGYRSALQRVAESLGGPAGEEILTALRSMDLGATRRDAFLALRTRNDSESLSTFVGAQLQAEELGVPLSEALNDIALDMRRSAAQNARRKAARAAPRISLIVTTLIVPGSIILILASMILGTDILDSGVLGGG